MLKNKIIELQNKIRKKNRVLKMEKIHMESVLQDTFRPITEPLKEISRNIEQKRDASDMSLITSEMNKSIKNEAENYSDTYSTPLTSKERRKLRRSQLFKSENLPTPIPTITENETIPQQLSRSLDAIIKHLGAAVSDKQIDSKYGIRLDDATNTLKMGNMEVKFDHEGNLQIGEKVYGTTPGLYKLMLLKNPEGYTKEDLNSYRDILFQTNVFRRNYNPRGQIKGAARGKYQNIIKNLIEHRSGEGLVQRPRANIELTGWGKSNDLLDLLRLSNTLQQSDEITKPGKPTILTSDDDDADDDCDDDARLTQKNDNTKSFDYLPTILGKRQHFASEHNTDDDDNDAAVADDDGDLNSSHTLRKRKIQELKPTSKKLRRCESTKPDIESNDPNVLVDELRALYGRYESIKHKIDNIINELRERQIIE